MLRARIITAVVLAPLLLGLIVYASSAVFAGVLACVAALGAGEWLRLAGVPGRTAAIFGAVSTIGVCLAVWFWPPARLPLLTLALLWWLIALFFVTSFPLRTASGAIFCDCPLRLSYFDIFPPYMILGSSGSATT